MKWLLVLLFFYPDGITVRGSYTYEQLIYDTFEECNATREYVFTEMKKAYPGDNTFGFVCRERGQNVREHHDTE